MENVRAKDVMTRWTWHCRASDPLSRVARKMRGHSCGFLPVLDDDDHLAGVVTDRDLGLAWRRADLNRDSEVASIMTRDVRTVGPDETMPKILEAIESSHLSRIVVAQDDGTVQGVISISGLAEQAEIFDLPADRLLATISRLVETPTVDLVE